MNGWWIGLLVVLALFAGAGAIAWVQAALVCSSRHRAARHAGHDSGAGPVEGTGPAPAPVPPEQHHEPGPWIQEAPPPRGEWEQRPLAGPDPYAGDYPGQALLTAPPAGDPRHVQWRDMPPARIPGYLP